MSDIKKKMKLGIKCLNRKCDGEIFMINILVPETRFEFICQKCGDNRVMSYSETSEEILKRKEELGINERNIYEELK